MKTLIYTVITAGALTLTALAGQDIAVDDLPKPVKDSIEAGFKGAKLIKAEKEHKNGMVIYEVKIEQKDLGRRELKLKEDGEVLKIEVED